jgi:hypothetical protein
MNPNLMHQMTQDRRNDLLREAEEYRRAELTARPTVLSRISARIPRFPTVSHRRRPRVVAPSTPGRMPQAGEDPPPERAIGWGETRDRLIDSVGARERARGARCRPLSAVQPVRRRELPPNQ